VGWGIIGDVASDLTPDSVENVVEDGVELVGEGVDAASDFGADRLEDVGLDGAAGWVRETGDSVANRLGADVGEWQLGQTEDPKQLIHGSVGKLRSTASHLRDFKKAFNDVGQGLRGVDAGEMRGETADAFHERVSVEPEKWFEAADACRRAARALSDFADTLEWAQGQAQDAIDRYAAADDASAEARAGYDAEVAAYNAAVEVYNATAPECRNPGTLPARPADEFHDPGPGEREAAEEILAEARRQRTDARDEAQLEIEAARDAAPPMPSYSEQVSDVGTGVRLHFSHFYGGIIRGSAGVLNTVRGVNPLDPYNLTHPGEYLTNLNSTAAGMVQMANDPAGAVSSMWDGFQRDPSEGVGRMVPELLGTRGAGGARAAANAARHAPDSPAPSPSPSSGREQVRQDGPDTNTTPNGGRESGPTDPVDLATGRMYLPQTDVVLPGALPLAFHRQVESGYRAGRWFGPSWTSTVDERLEIDAEGVVFLSEDGLVLTYPHPAPGVPTFPSTGPRRPLERTAEGDYLLTDPGTGRTRHFAAPPGAPNGGDGQARLVQVADRNGNRYTIDYDDAGVPTGIVHTSGYHLKLTTDRGRITALHLADAAEDGTDLTLVRYGYTDGNLTEVTNSSGLPLRFEYDDERRVVAWTDTNNRRYDYVYDRSHRCVAEGGSEGHLAVRIAYGQPDPATGQRDTAVTTSQGHASRYTIDAHGRVIATTDPAGHTTRTAYDPYGRVTARTDALGHTTGFRYDERGNLVTVTRPDGGESTATYNELDLPTVITEPGGAVWRQEYDQRGNRTAVTDPAGHTTRYHHDESGHLTAVTDPAGRTTHLRCDPAGLPVEMTDPLGAVTTCRRDAFGRPTAITDPLGGTVHLSWTPEGHLAQRTDADGARQSWAWDGEGNCVTHTDPIGSVTSFEYTHFDLLAARTDPDGTRYTFEHDTDLSLRKVTNPQGLTWTYAYDPAGHLTSETDFDGRTLRYTNDPAGRVTSRTNPLGQTLTFERDALGRVVRKVADGRTTTYTYDPAGHLTMAAGPDAQVIYRHDRMGRIKAEMTDGRVLTHTYDQAGRRTRRSTPTGATTTFRYDPAGRRTTLTTSGHTLDFTYDLAGRETTRRIGDADLTLTHTWDPIGRLTTQTLTSPTSPARPLRHRAYTYRPDGHLTAIHDPTRGDQTFDLDQAGRVTAVHAHGWTETYAYDTAGNQTHATWPDRHPTSAATGPRAYTGTRLTHAGRMRYEHDAAGRVTLRQKTRLSKKPDTWHYTWDAEDHLTAVTTPDGTHWRYLYDPLGRRIAKQRLAPDSETIVEQTDFTWDHATLIEQTTTAPTLPHPVTLTWDHDGLHPIAQTERIINHHTQEEIDSRFFAIITDLVGTPTDLIDETGTTAWHTRTTLWGTTTWHTDSTAYTPLRFPGQYHDPETGLHYNHHRHYDPETARYTTPDPLGLTPAPNPHTYVHNPHTWTDPLGLAPCPAGDPDAHGSRDRDHATDSVWSRISATQPNYPGTELPRSFNLDTSSGQQIWVHGNATKHIEEEIRQSTFSRPLKTEDLLASFVRAVDSATIDGIQYGHRTLSEGWELIIARPRGGEGNPVIMHARRIG
jgi:RHS repeat-associated protein